ncbi:BON domain-containing protein [Paraburkholderia sp. A3BS-1L]|uniref:BON domain-containing protein n=1 Tax=Paraburkholderia sp. A3BS-1L TaxID=3028375 RepID=UPI003DA82CBD
MIGISRAARAMFELAWDLALDASGIKVGVKDRIVTLSGWAPDYAQKLATERAAGRVAGRVAGCRAIALGTVERPAAGPRPSRRLSSHRDHGRLALADEFEPEPGCAWRSNIAA